MRNKNSNTKPEQYVENNQVSFPLLTSHSHVVTRGAHGTVQSPSQGVRSGPPGPERLRGANLSPPFPLLGFRVPGPAAALLLRSQPS